MDRYYHQTGTTGTVGFVLRDPDREAIKTIVVAMRTRAGTRKRLADLVGAESTSTPQGWEKLGRTPSGPQLAALLQLFPDLAQDLLRAIAPGVSRLEDHPPTAAEVAERAARVAQRGP